jgi:hypothetical protein
MAQQELELVLAEARSEIAAGRIPNADALRARLRGDEEGLAQLDRVLAVHRARSRLTREPAPPEPKPSLRSALRTKPTINANMDVRRGRPFELVWDAAPAIVAWELRLSERPDPRSDYAPIETRELPGETTSVELPLGEAALKVHLLGRSRDGRLLRRAVIAGLTRDGWNERWQRRASAS